MNFTNRELLIFMDIIARFNGQLRDIQKENGVPEEHMQPELQARDLVMDFITKHTTKEEAMFDIAALDPLFTKVFKTLVDQKLEQSEGDLAKLPPTSEYLH